jgi:hypothetical protein
MEECESDCITHGSDSFPNARRFLLHNAVTHFIFSVFVIATGKSISTHRSVVAFFNAFATSVEWRLFTLRPIFIKEIWNQKTALPERRSEGRLTPSFWTRAAQKNWSLQVRVIQHVSAITNLSVRKPKHSPEPRPNQSRNASWSSRSSSGRRATGIEHCTSQAGTSRAGSAVM